MKIAAGAAKGLEYLHNHADPPVPVIFRDLKSSNILLDKGFHPKLSDFGLAKLGPVGDKTHVSTRAMGTYGYCAPEYTMTGQLTLKSDVYSFGVVLLELITGRKAIGNNRAPGEDNLIAWARPQIKSRKNFPQMADPLLKGQYPMRGLHLDLAVAAMCLQEQVATRPLIGDVITTLTCLASQKYDLNTAPAPRTMSDRKSLVDSHGSPSTHKNSPDLRRRINRGGDSGRSGRNWDGLEREKSSRDSPNARKTHWNWCADRERAVADAKVWGENWRERRLVNGARSFDAATE